jgi:hypothetical protein
VYAHQRLRLAIVGRRRGHKPPGREGDKESGIDRIPSVSPFSALPDSVHCLTQESGGQGLKTTIRARGGLVRRVPTTPVYQESDPRKSCKSKFATIRPSTASQALAEFQNPNSPRSASPPRPPKPQPQNPNRALPSPGAGPLVFTYSVNYECSDDSYVFR